MPFYYPVPTLSSAFTGDELHDWEFFYPDPVAPSGGTVASFTFTKAKYLFLTKEVDLDGGSTIRIALLMTNTSVTTAGQEDVATVSALSVLDEMNGTNYARIDVTSSCSVTQDDTNNRAVFTFDDQTWTSLGAGSRNMAGILVIYDPTNTNADATNVPLFWLDGGFPQSGTGTDFVYTPNTAGVVYLG